MKFWWFCLIVFVICFVLADVGDLWISWFDCCVVLVLVFYCCLCWRFLVLCWCSVLNCLVWLLVIGELLVTVCLIVIDVCLCILDLLVGLGGLLYTLDGLVGLDAVCGLSWFVCVIVRLAGLMVLRCWFVVYVGLFCLFV